MCNAPTKECPNTYPYQNKGEELTQNTNPVNRCYLSVAFIYPFFIRGITIQLYVS